MAKNVAQEEGELKLKLLELQLTRSSRGLVEGLDAGFLPQGARIVDPKSPEEGRTFVFTPEEAQSLVEPLKKIAAARYEVAQKDAAARIAELSKPAATPEPAEAPADDSKSKE